MIKLSKKDLKELAQSLDSFYCGGNVYNHENITYYITHKEFDKLANYNLPTLRGNIEYMLNDLNINKEDKLSYIVTSSLVAYSCGTYGNTAQLVKYIIINQGGNDRTFYTYYC